MADDRILAYADRFSNYLTGLIEDDTARTIADELQLSPDNINSLVIDITGDDFIKLFSAALAGTTLLYGTEGENLLWYLWRAASVNNFLCNRVAECLELQVGPNGETILVNKNNATVISEVNTLESLSLYDANNSSVVDAGGGDTDCNIFGASMALVDFLNVETRNWLAAIAGAGDTIDAISLALASVPFIGSVYDFSGFDDAVDAFTNIGNVLLSAYDAAWDINLQRDLACDLYCAIKDNGYVFTKSIFESVLVTWLANHPLNAAVTGIEVLSTWTTAAAFRYIAREYTLGLNNPDCDYAILCTQCGCTSVQFYYDFRSQSYSPIDWNPRSAGSSWISGSGWKGQLGTPFGTQMIYDRIEASQKEVQYVKFEASAGGVTVNHATIHDIYNGGANIDLIANMTPIGNDEYEWTGSYQLQGRLLVVTAADLGTPFLRDVNVTYCE